MLKRIQLRPPEEKFQNSLIFGKMPYYRPWFFGVFRRILKEPNFYMKASLESLRTMVC